MAFLYKYYVWLSLRRERVFFNRSDPRQSLTDSQLIDRYRFPRTILLELINIPDPVVRPATNCSVPISSHMQILVALQYFASGSFFRVDGDVRGLSGPSVSRIIH